MNLVTQLDHDHQPNTPRTHDSSGQTVEELPQCRKCLQSWPCKTKRLLGIIKGQAMEIHRLSDELRAREEARS